MPWRRLASGGPFGDAWLEELQTLRRDVDALRSRAWPGAIRSSFVEEFSQQFQGLVTVTSLNVASGRWSVMASGSLAYLPNTGYHVVRWRVRAHDVQTGDPITTGNEDLLARYQFPIQDLLDDQPVQLQPMIAGTFEFDDAARLELTVGISGNPLAEAPILERTHLMAQPY